jgi:hypothetical protein
VKSCSKKLEDADNKAGKVIVCMWLTGVLELINSVYWPSRGGGGQGLRIRTAVTVSCPQVVRKPGTWDGVR